MFLTCTTSNSWHYFKLDIHMQSFLTAKDVEKFQEKIGLPAHFCVAPFVTLLLEPDGKVGACRHKGSEFPVGNILQQSFEEIWNGTYLKQWRKEFLEGKPQICKTEVKDRKCNLCPSYNRLLEFAEIQEVQSKRPSRIAFNFNGHCNLECVMCHIWQKENGLYDRIGFWNEIDPWIQDLQEVELLSGEPFIQKDTYRLIDLLSEKRPQAKWTITTNANWKLNDFIKKKLDLIEVKNIIVSLDSTNELTYQQIRKKGNFSQALETLRGLKTYEQVRIDSGKSPLGIKINFLIQLSNWQELAAVSKFSNDEGVEVFRTFLYEPSEFSLLSLKEIERVSILEWYFTRLTKEEIKTSFRVIRPLLDSLSDIEKSYFYEKLL